MNSIDDYPDPQEISDHYVHEIHLLFDSIPEKMVPFEIIRKFNYEYAEKFIQQYADDKPYLKTLTRSMVRMMHKNAEIEQNMSQQRFFIFAQVTMELWLLHIVKKVIEFAEENYLEKLME